MSSADKSPSPLPIATSENNTSNTRPQADEPLAEFQKKDLHEIPLTDSQYIPQKSNIKPLTEEQSLPLGQSTVTNPENVLSDSNQLVVSQIKNRENIASEEKGKDQQTSQENMGVDDIRHSVGRKLKMRTLSDDNENNLGENAIPLAGSQKVVSLDFSEAIETIKDLVKNIGFNEEVENDILNELDELKRKLENFEVEEIEEQKTAELNCKIEEKDQLKKQDDALSKQLEKIKKETEEKSDAIEQCKKEFESEKNMLELNFAQLKSNLEVLTAFESSLGNGVEDSNKVKDKEVTETDELNEKIAEFEANRKKDIEKLESIKNKKKDIKEREYDASQEIEELKEKLNSLKEIEEKFEEVVTQLDKIANKIQEGEHNIGELNKNLEEARKSYKEEIQRFEKEKLRQETERKKAEKQKQDIEQSLKEIKAKDSEHANLQSFIKEEAKKRQEERVVLMAKVDGPGGIKEVENELNEKEKRYKEWEADLSKIDQHKKEVKNLKEEIEHALEEVKSIEEDYRKLSREYQRQGQIQDELTVNFQLQRKEELEEWNQKLNNAWEELEVKGKKRSGPLANFCVAFINTGLMGLLVLGFIYISNISVPGFE